MQEWADRYETKLYANLLTSLLAMGGNFKLFSRYFWVHLYELVFEKA
jgi:hypothetical protein